MMRIAHVITGLGTGGAETTLLRLLSRLQAEDCRHHVIALTGMEGTGDAIRALGVPVACLGMRNGIPDPRALLRLTGLLRRLRPTLVQTWMYHANLLGGLAALPVGGVPVVWNLRRGRLDPRIDKRGTRWTSKICAALSRRLPARIVCCAEFASRAHIAAGYAEEKMIVIPGGFDVDRFRPDPQARAALRQEWNITEETPVAGMVARFDPAKDHRGFARAAARVAAAVPQVRFVLCGERVSPDNTVLSGWLKEAGIASRCLLLDRRQDVPRVMAALDVAVSSSAIEGFPNAVGEAMACGLACAVTDAGDSALLVGEAGRVVPAADPDALAGACRELLDSPGLRAELGMAAKRRISERFSLDAAARRYRRLYEETVSDVRDRRIS